MLIDTDLIFDDIQGYEFYHKCEIKAVIDDKAKGEDGEILEFYENIEFILDEFDEVIILRKRSTVQELEELKSYMIKQGEVNLAQKIDPQIAEAIKNGTYIIYACIHDDTFYDLHSFNF